jgi:hypothetical protein
LLIYDETEIDPSHLISKIEENAEFLSFYSQKII